MDITGRFMFPSPWGIARLAATATGGKDGMKVPQSVEALSDDGAWRASELITFANSSKKTLLDRAPPSTSLLNKCETQGNKGNAQERASQ
ncbi:uncharacterized protein EAE98_008510 [Botrytis deweyae]|uniref:Uncharacterized protein n=1 Tax=Botrytis deweyae TaxID=2478750 RepID=A0ABQ7IES0_9HELO|nr:uncharacterized protein EAE98_008510 [Botrytis deweyae]KAF7921663.1 hypothetical protein EAE98_008510 [Botrytis deweyae]